MKEEIYEYLHDYGFSAIELDKMEKENEGMFFTDLTEIRKNITFLEEKYLETEDIINIINNNPFMLTEKNNRLDALDEIYNGKLLIDYESLKSIIKRNPEAYTSSPVELQKNIDYLKQKNCTVETIRNLIIKNPKIISMSFIEFEKVVKFN